MDLSATSSTVGCLQPSCAVSYATVGESPDGRRITCRVVARNQHDEVVGVSLHIIWDSGGQGDALLFRVPKSA